jgi:hypothetical protein
VFIGGGAEELNVEVFDAFESARFTTLSEEGPARTGAVLAPFGNGRSLLVGGVDADGEFVSGAIVLNPTGLTLQQEPHEGSMVTGHAAATLVDDSVIVAGGRTPDGVTAAGWLYPTFGPGDLDARESLPPLSIARADHTMTRLGSELGADVLIVGGQDVAGVPIAEAELYRPLREVYEPVDGPLLVPRWGHEAVRMPGGFVLIIGGLNPAPVTTLELYDPVQGVFSDAGSMPAGAGLTDFTVTPLPDGRVLLAGGLDAAGTPVAATHIARLDPIDGRVVVIPTEDMDVPRANHTAVQLCDGTTLVVGGTDVENAAAERYNPPSKDRR